ncbi:CmcI family methyltransferase [Metabacillus arenae]|uniref:Class I SAM-dependent methyltransferase n=1 Tax=Metabacillus arenae TaxID=2771434 RepID=A0A926ND74_9BACI|nr:CmcI family methyltransferase [Metabacillus arenae]MBD1378985.1 class I SAM-dependent methyltransferase [Metabacillus arenae]
MDLFNSFHKYYYESRVWGGNTKWMGCDVLKCPLDLWIYQEIIYETKPDWIIECGTHLGGTSLYLASICELIGKGKIITIDIKDNGNHINHPRIEFLIGSSVSSQIEKEIQKKIKKEESVMVILDSDHTKSHVLQELEMYQTFVTKGNYLIVEDTNINGNPVLPDFGDGPLEAVEEFLSKNDQFIIDHSCEKFILTFNPNGYLKKIK